MKENRRRRRAGSERWRRSGEMLAAASWGCE
jgi:hypothetical protein